jgi:hypothetical protein
MQAKSLSNKIDSIDKYYYSKGNFPVSALFIGYCGFTPLKKWITSFLLLPAACYCIITHGHYSLIDNADLIIHEAGHFFFGFMGSFIQAAGGTLMQILFPSFLAWYFYRNGYRSGLQIFIFWLGQNLLNISVYAADAVVQQLPLLGNGKHDWYYLLGQLGILRQAEVVGLIFFVLSIVVFIIVLFLPIYLEE